MSRISVYFLLIAFFSSVLSAFGSPVPVPADSEHQLEKRARTGRVSFIVIPLPQHCKSLTARITHRLPISTSDWVTAANGIRTAISLLPSPQTPMPGVRTATRSAVTYSSTDTADIDIEPVQYVKITDIRTGKTANAMVRDSCPGCGSNDLGMFAPPLLVNKTQHLSWVLVLDMSPSLFQHFEPLSKGTFRIKWFFL